MILASAPGKLIITGEYAVLRGAPALVAAVDVRTEVSLAPSSAPGFNVHTGNGSGHINAHGQPDAVEADLELPAAVIATLASRFGPFPAGWELTLDSSGFRRQDLKMGLGSSAAVTVALLAALLTALDKSADTATLLELAREAHHRFQGGRGSGADLAAAVHGHTVVYTADARLPEPAGWPPGLVIRPVWTGTPASTTAMLEKLEAWAAAEPDAHDAALGRLSEAAVMCAAVWRSGEARAVLDALDGFTACLQAFDEASGIGVFGGGHDAFAEQARSLGLQYKPSGAGGGDFGLLCGRSDADWAAAESAFEGLAEFSTGQGVDGVRVEDQRT